MLLKDLADIACVLHRLKIVEMAVFHEQKGSQFLSSLLANGLGHKGIDASENKVIIALTPNFNILKWVHLREEPGGFNYLFRVTLTLKKAILTHGAKQTPIF